MEDEYLVEIYIYSPPKKKFLNFSDEKLILQLFYYENSILKPSN